jgi:hypothetical protein
MVPFCQKIRYKIVKAASLDRFPDVGHQALIIPKVMYRIQMRAENLITLVQVVQVGAAVMPAGITVTFRVKWRGIIAKTGISEPQHTL